MKVCVIGGGPAGMAAAWAAGMAGHEVTLYEKNEKLGKKLYITGKGRCNATNTSGLDGVIKNTVRNPKFLYSALSSFTNEDFMDFLTRYGVPLKTERGGRVFPLSDKSSDVIKAFDRALHDAKVDVRLNSPVDKVVCEGGRFRAIALKGRGLEYGACIVATGGESYPSTGSTGDGYRFAAENGIAVTERRPSLVPLIADDGFVPELAGVTLKNVGLRLMQNGREAYSELGELLFTHTGVSGPLALSASAYLKWPVKNAACEIDLKPGLDDAKLDARLLRDFAQSQNKAVKNALSGLLINALITPVLLKSGVEAEKKVNSLTSAERKRLISAIKRFDLNIVGTHGPNEAIVTRGGVDVRMINAKTMESRLVRALYFCGETLDVDALTGGYNIQIAVSTGYLAGSSV